MVCTPAVLADALPEALSAAPASGDASAADEVPAAVSSRWSRLVANNGVSVGGGGEGSFAPPGSEVSVSGRSVLRSRRGERRDYT